MRFIFKVIVFLFGLLLCQLPVFHTEVRNIHHQCYLPQEQKQEDAWGHLQCISNKWQMSFQEHERFFYSSSLSFLRGTINGVAHVYALILWEPIMITYHQLYWYNLPPSLICMQLTGIVRVDTLTDHPSICQERIFVQVNTIIIFIQLWIYTPLFIYTLYRLIFISNKHRQEREKQLDDIKDLLQQVLRERRIVYVPRNNNNNKRNDQKPFYSIDT